MSVQRPSWQESLFRLKSTHQIEQQRQAAGGRPPHVGLRVLQQPQQRAVVVQPPLQRHQLYQPQRRAGEVPRRLCGRASACGLPAGSGSGS